MGVFLGLLLCDGRATLCVGVMLLNVGVVSVEYISVVVVVGVGTQVVEEA